MIRKANLSDLDQIEAIRKSLVVDPSRLDDPTYAVKVQKEGFLLGTDDPHDMSAEIQNAFMFWVVEEQGEILGYLIADHSSEQLYYDDEYKTWFDVDLKVAYYGSNSSMSLATIAVKTQSSHQGVATMLLEHLKKELLIMQFTHLFSIVTLGPVTNCASLIWHTRHGFKRLAMSRPRTLFGFDGHSAVLLYKKLV